METQVVEKKERKVVRVRTKFRKFVDKQGRTANYNGNKLERMTSALLLKKKGIYTCSYKEWLTGRGKTLKRVPKNAAGVLLRSAPYITMYGSNGRGDFLLTRDGYEDIRIECRGQKVAGSVDEKLPYLFGNCLSVDERKIIVVLEGNGCKSKARDWFISQAKAIKYKDIKVLTFAEFAKWVDKNL